MERYIKTKTGVNFRKGPGTEHASIKVLPAGTVVQVLDNVDGTTWYHAKTEDGVVGYITALTKYVEGFEPEWLATVKAVVAYGESYIGTNYVFGSNRSTDKDFDCSDFTRWIYKKAGVNLGADSRSQAVQGQPVSLNDLRTGDLIFYSKDGRVYHVGMYVHENKLLHTYNTQVDLTYSKFGPGDYWRKNAAFARRIIQ